MSSGCSCYSCVCRCVCVCVLLLWFQKSHFPHSRLRERGSALLLPRKLCFSLELINKLSVILDSKGLKMWGSLWLQCGTSGTSRLQPWHQQEVLLTKSSCWFVKNLLFKPPPSFSDQNIVSVLKTSIMGSTFGFLNAVLFKKSASSPSSSTSTSRMEVYWSVTYYDVFTSKPTGVLFILHQTGNYRFCLVLKSWVFLWKVSLFRGTTPDNV